MIIEEKFLRSIMREATIYYFIWYVVHLVLGLGSIILPAFAAMGYQFLALDLKYLAGLGSLSASIYAFIRPNEFASNFDLAIAKIRSIERKASVQADEKNLQDLDEIYNLMSFRYTSLRDVNK